MADELELYLLRSSVHMYWCSEEDWPEEFDYRDFLDNVSSDEYFERIRREYLPDRSLISLKVSFILICALLYKWDLEDERREKE